MESQNTLLEILVSGDIEKAKLLLDAGEQMPKEIPGYRGTIFDNIIRKKAFDIAAFL